MHEKVLSRGSRELLTKLDRLERPELRGWTLGGDTGLALQLGHRVSDDLEFFRNDGFAAGRLLEILRRISTVGVLQEDEGAVSVIVSATKVTFSSVPSESLFPGQPHHFYQLADPRDIALMKLAAVSDRGSRRDFVDLYTILRGGLSLEQCFQWLPLKYGEGWVNPYHVLMSLSFFEEAEREPMPRMLEPFDWAECKNFFIRETHAIVLP